MATATVPVKELSGLAVMLTGDPVAPAVMDSEVGDSVRVKSGVEEMVSVTVVECESIPEVPVIVSIVLLGIAAAEAVSATV
jgi:hypothetical protein